MPVFLFILSSFRWGFSYKKSPTINFLLVQYVIAVNYVGSGTSATWATNGYTNVQTNPLYTTRSGNFDGGSFLRQASSGYLWSGTTYSGTNAYYLSYYSSSVYPAYDGYNRQNGFPVRCIAGDFPIIIKKIRIHFNNHNQKFSGNRAFRKIFILSFLRWGFFFRKEAPKRSVALIFYRFRIIQPYHRRYRRWPICPRPIPTRPNIKIIIRRPFRTLISLHDISRTRVFHCHHI